MTAQIPFRARNGRTYASTSQITTLPFIAPGDVANIDGHWYTVLSLRAVSASQEYFVVAVHNDLTDEISCNVYPGAKKYHVFRQLHGSD